MRRSSLTVLTLFCAAPAALAHEGHGVVEATNPAHLFEPLHLIWILGAAVALGAAAVVRRRSARRA